MKHLKHISLIATALLAATLLLTSCNSSNGTISGQPGDAPQEDFLSVVAQHVEKVILRDTHSVYASIKGVSEGQILSFVSGEVSSIYVKSGDNLVNGSPIFELKSTGLNRQIAQAKKSVELAQSNFDTAESRYNEALETLKKNKALLASGAITEAQYDQVKAQATPAQRDASAIQLDQARLQLRQLNDSLSDYTITAKTAGKLAQFDLKVGDAVQPGQVLGKIIDTQSYQIEGAVAESLFTKLTLKTPVTITIESLDKTFPGQIVELGPLPKAGAKLFPVKITFKSSPTENLGTIKANGLTAKVTFELGNDTPVIAIKSDVLLKDAEGSYLYKLEGIVGDDLSSATPKRVYIKTGFDNGQWVVVEEGLVIGDWIVVKGQHYITLDTQIRVLKEEE